MTAIILRYSDVVTFCKTALGEKYAPPAGYTWWDTFWALTKRRKWPKHPQANVLKALGLNLPFNRAGKNISPFTTKITINQ